MGKALMAMGVLTLITVNAAHAQSREGFWIGFGVGAGSLEVGSDPRQSAPVGYLKFGGTINQTFLLGVETNAWIKEGSPNGTLTHMNFSAVAYVYPSDTSGFFLKGGLGWARLADDQLSLNGSGAVLGLGFDARVGDNFSITPYGNFTAGAFLFSTNIFEVGVGVSWH